MDPARQIFRNALKDMRSLFKEGRRVKLIRYSGANTRKFLKVNEIYIIRKIEYKDNLPHSIFLKGCSKRFSMEIFEIIFNRYDMIKET